MFDLIVAYLVIMFLVNTAKAAKEQQTKQTPKNKPIGKPYGNKRLPGSKQKTAQPQTAAPRTAPTSGPVVLFPEELKPRTAKQSVESQGKNRRETVKKTAPGKAVGAAIAADEKKLHEILEPTEENILTGLVWSEILGPPVCKRSRRY